MSTQPVISVENVSKFYTLSHTNAASSYGSLRDMITESASGLRRSIFGKAQKVIAPETEQFWALKDVNFAIKQGEVVGIIGRNGAGKSTLLKILSRITEPSQGRVVLEGRVASLLEVGTGFHPELTGRENIFLNGAVLGMSRAEIKRKFDEIVDFAEVERFLDTPVKRYSSGMYVRLAFAVAAHLEPEILIIDEVLAVGDAEFQRKCLGKMSEVAGHGRTVLFVSHNLAAVQTLCSRAIYLADGRVIDDGPTSSVVVSYLGRGKSHLKKGSAKAGAKLQLNSIVIDPPIVRTGAQVSIQINFTSLREGNIRECALLVHSKLDERIALIDLRQMGFCPANHYPGSFDYTFHIPNLSLNEGDYQLGVYLVTDDFSGDQREMAELCVSAPDFNQAFAPYAANARGFVALEAKPGMASS
jgi:lipopolysaccharide transport system ATP-binding protein